MVKLRDRKQNGGCQGLGEGRNGELLVIRYRVSVLQDEEGSGDWLHNIENVLDATELNMCLWMTGSPFFMSFFFFFFFFLGCPCGIWGFPG